MLGPLEIAAGDGPLPLGTRKQQLLLALLLLNAGRTVATSELVDELWPESPPASALPNVRNYAARLRRLLAEARHSDGATLVRHGRGYRLDVGPAWFDVDEFTALTTAGRAAMERGGLDEAVERLAAARALWRGRACAGLPRGPQLRAHCTALEDERSLTCEALAEALIVLDRPGDAIGVLRAQVTDQPLREAGHALLMRALHRTGDIAGALAAYAHVRQVLAEHLGVEPGRELQELHRAILNREDDPEPPRPREAVAAGAPAPFRPQELPAEIGQFVGRQGEVAGVVERLRPAGTPPRQRPTVVLLFGPGGAGKSALALRIAHRVADGFPDGQLYVNLLGATPGLRPPSTVEVLGRLLRSLGVPDVDVPPGEEDAAARFRSLTAGRRLLLLLDNAADAAQVAALLPASGSSAVLVTSRGQLSSLDADRRIRVGGLPEREATLLLRRLVPDVVISEPAGAAIVALCEHLPLAIRIAAGRLMSRPGMTAVEFAARLGDRRRRLDELELEGLAVRSCIRVGYEALLVDGSATARTAARAFPAIGVLNVPDVSAPLVASMLAEPLPAVRQALEHLVQAQLLEAQPGDRYRLHDLVRLVAIEQASECDEPGAAADAVWRGLLYFTEGLRRANDVLRPGRDEDVPRFLLPTGLSPPEFAEPAQARAWLDAEIRCVTAAAEQAAQLAHAPEAMLLSLVRQVWPHLQARHQWDETLRLGLLLIGAGRRSPASELTGWGHLVVGTAEADLGQIDRARHHFELARDCHAATGSGAGMVITLNSLGIVTERAGDGPRALEHFGAALRFARKNRSLAMEGVILHNLGSLCGHLGMDAESLAYLRASLRIRSRSADPSGLGSTLANLAAISCILGDLDAAVDRATAAIEWCRQSGHQLREHEALLVRAEAYLRLGELDRAASDVDTVLALSRVRRHRYAAAAALRQRGKLLAARGDARGAAAARTEAEAAFAHPLVQRDLLTERLLTQPWPARGGDP